MGCLRLAGMLINSSVPRGTSPVAISPFTKLFGFMAKIPLLFHNKKVVHHNRSCSAEYRHAPGSCVSCCCKVCHQAHHSLTFCNLHFFCCVLHRSSPYAANLELLFSPSLGNQILLLHWISYGFATAWEQISFS